MRTPGYSPRRLVVADREANGPFADLEDFVIRTGLPRPALEALATAGAFGCFGVAATISNAMFVRISRRISTSFMPKNYEPNGASKSRADRICRVIQAKPLASLIY